jgi:hypothetical protein
MGGGALLFAAGIPTFNFLGGMMLAIPFAIGAFIGYGSNSSAPGAVFLGWIVAVLCVVEFLAMLGSEWACMLGVVSFVPGMLGGVCGWALRRAMKSSADFSQNDYLSE